MKHRKLISLALALVMCLSAFPVSALAAEEEPRKTEFFTEQPHTELSFDELTYEPVEAEPILAEMEEIRSLLNDGANMEKVSEGFDGFCDDLTYVLTMYSLLNIQTYLDVTDADLAVEQARVASVYTELADGLSILMRDILNSPCAPFLEEQMTEEDIEYYKNYEPMTEEEKTYSAKETELDNGYYQLAAQPITVEYEGTEWDENTIYAAAVNGEVDMDTYNLVATLLAQKKNAIQGEYYLEMVEFHKEMAAAEGYDNYGDYAYEMIYDRDYTQEEIRSFHAAVKAYIVPLYAEVEDLYWDDRYSGVMEEALFADYTGDIALDMIEPYLGRMSSELVEAFTYMREHGFYDSGYSETKSQGGFTTSLNSYGAPFFYNSPNGNLTDFSTAVHEFGHYNNSYWQPMDIMSASKSIDIAEVHSQGLELLFSHWYPEIFGEEAGEAVLHFLLMNLLGSMVEGCLHDELQQFVYATDNVTLEQINQEYRRLCGEYGMCEPDDPRTEMYSWVDIPHTFSQPCYYISYATSAAGAFSFWLEAQREDYITALDNYLTFTALPAEMGFTESFEEVGLEAPYSYNYVSRLAWAIRRNLAGLGDMADYDALIQYNGEFITFPDAQPTIVNDRTMLPIRALVEAIGGQVEWNEAEQQVKLTLNGTVVTLTIGENAITVTKDGETVTGSMDVAPFIEPVTGRTYVPVRFVSEAFGIQVGWDEAYRAAVLLDMNALVEQATQGKSYTNLESLAQFIAQQQERTEKGIWNTTGSLEGALTIGGMIQVPMAAAFEAAAADQSQFDMTMSMTIDMTQLMALLAMTGSAPNAATQAQLKALAEDGIKVLYRGDLAAGKVYMTFEGAVMETMGMPANTWFLMDLNALAEAEGVDYAELMGGAQDVETALLPTDLPLNDAVSLSGVCELVGVLAASVADDAFVTEGSTRTLTVPYEDETTQMVLTLILNMEGEKIAQAGLALDLAAYEAESETLTQMAVTVVMDKMGKSSGMMAVSSGEELALELTFGSETAQGTKAPALEPPADAVVINLFEENGETPSAADILNGMMGIMPLGE